MLLNLVALVFLLLGGWAMFDDVPDKENALLVIGMCLAAINIFWMLYDGYVAGKDDIDQKATEG
jgi:hypothetical protein